MAHAILRQSFANILRRAAVCAALLLISTFILHAAIPHDHPEEVFGTGAEAALHSGDKKWWVLLVLVTFAFGISAKNHLVRGDYAFRRGSHSLLRYEHSIIFDPLREALRGGTMHPKLCG